jgi:hypothetical protein
VPRHAGTEAVLGVACADQDGRFDDWLARPVWFCAGGAEEAAVKRVIVVIAAAVSVALPAQGSARALFGAPQRVLGVGTNQVHSWGPSLAAFDGRLYMAWKGAAYDPEIYWNYDAASGWAPPQKVGGARTSGRPSLAVSHGRLYLAWKGVGHGGVGNRDVHHGSDIHWASSR